MIYSIPLSEIKSKNIPVKDDNLFNRIVVSYSELVLDAADSEIYKSPKDIVLGNNASIVLDIAYSAIPSLSTGITPTITASVGSASITSSTYYSNGASVTVLSGGAGATFKLSLSGRKLVYTPKLTAIAQDAESIKEYGILEYKFKDSYLIQTLTQAQAIADSLLATYKQDRTDINLEWSGNPMVEPTDTILVPEYGNVIGEFEITKNEFAFDGSLMQKTEGKRV